MTESVKQAPMYAGACADCGRITAIDRGDATGVPNPHQWDSFQDCLVCGGVVDFDEQVETMWDRESRLMRTASKRVLEGAAQMLDSLADENRDGGVDYDATVYDAAAREIRRFAEAKFAGASS